MRSPAVTASQVAEAIVPSCNALSAMLCSPSLVSAALSFRSFRATSSAERRSASVCPGAELLARLIEMKSDDRKDRQRGDREEQRDVAWGRAGVADNVCVDVSKREHAEPCGPAEIWKQSAGSAPPATLCSVGGSAGRASDGCERGRQRLAIGEAGGRVAVEAAIDRRSERLTERPARRSSNSAA